MEVLVWDASFFKGNRLPYITFAVPYPEYINAYDDGTGGGSSRESVALAMPALFTFRNSVVSYHVDHRIHTKTETCANEVDLMVKRQVRLRARRLLHTLCRCNHK
jgi:hypothetical protein